MDAVSYAHSAKQAQRIEKFIENPDSTSGIVTVPKTIASGETITIPAGRVAVLPNVVVDGDLVVEAGGEVFVPAGANFSDLDQRIDALANTAVKLTGNETIAGTKTFSSNPIVPTPTANTQAANKGYVDTKISGLGTVATKSVGTSVGQVIVNSNDSLMGAIASATIVGVVGFWEITLPYKTDSDIMLGFQIKEYSDYRLSTMDVSGYLYEVIDNWYLPLCTISGTSLPTVKFGRNQAGYAVVVVEAGNYSGIGIYNTVGGYNKQVNLHGTTITHHTTLPSYTYVASSPIIQYHTGNTTKSPDGTIKASSPVINLYTDKHDLHNESQFGATPAVVRKSKGVYEITGTLGLRSEGWYLDTPSDRNGNKYFNIEWTQNITPDTVDGVVDEYRDDIVVTIETFERVWNKDTGLFENGNPIDINDLQNRFVQLRFNELEVQLEVTNG